MSKIRFSRVTTERGLKSKQFSSWLFRSVRPENVRLLLREGKGSETQGEDKRKVLFFFLVFLGFFFSVKKWWFRVLYRGKLREKIRERIGGGY